MSRLLLMLNSGGPLLMDGAMGSELLRAGARAGECLEAWNLTQPDKVQAIHRAYVAAGARVLLTNTFQANRANLARHGLQDRLEEIVRAAVTLARECAGGAGFVLGDIGPSVNPDRPGEPPDPAAAADLLPGLDSADGILLETWSDPGALSAARHCRPLLPAEKPLLLSLTYRRDQDGRLVTLSGHPPEFFAGQAEASGVNALGVNCGRDIGMEDIVEIIGRYRTTTALPLFARPNAGTPKRMGEGWEYPYTPEWMAEHLHALLQAGATMIGGCCGTTPEHIAAMCRILEPVRKRRG